MSTQNIIDSFGTKFELFEINEASDNAQDAVSQFLLDQGEGVEITIENGEVMVSAPQEIMDASNDFAGFCDDLQDRFNEYFKDGLSQIEQRKLIAE